MNSKQEREHDRSTEFGSVPETVKGGLDRKRKISKIIQGNKREKQGCRTSNCISLSYQTALIAFVHLTSAE